MVATLDEALLQVVSIARYTLSAATSLNTSSATGNTGGDAVILFNNNMVANYNVLNNLQAVGGIVAYVQNQYNQPATFDVLAAFNNLKTAMLNTASWIDTAVTGVYLYVPNATTKAIDPAQFTPAQTAGLRTQLGLLITACNGMLP